MGKSFNIYGWAANVIKEHIEELPPIKELKKKEGIEFATKHNYNTLLLYLLENYPPDVGQYIRRLHYYANLFSKQVEKNSPPKSKPVIRNSDLIQKLRQYIEIIDDWTKTHKEYEVLLGSKYKKNTFVVLTLFMYYYELFIKKPASSLFSDEGGESDLDLEELELIRETEFLPVYWEIDPESYFVNDYGGVVVTVKNFEPKETISFLDNVKDRNGVIFDIIFTSLLFSFLDFDYFRDEQLIPQIIYKTIGDFYHRYKKDHDSVADAFRYWQAKLTRYIESIGSGAIPDYESLNSFLSRLRSLVNTLNHLIYIQFDIDIRDESVKKTLRISPYYLVAKKPGTHWVYANFIYYSTTDLVDTSIKMRTNDVVLFKPSILDDKKPITGFPPVKAHNPYLLEVFSGDPTKSTDTYLVLIRSHEVRKKRKGKEDEEEEETVVKIVPELLSVVPISLNVSIIRTSTYEKKKKVERVKEDLGFDSKPKSVDDVLESLYLLARIYNPNYKHYYPLGTKSLELLGWDQYLTLIFSTLTFLSPSRVLSTLTMDYDVRIHTLLYGMKGTGKTLILRNFTERIAPGASIFIDPSKNDTIAGLIGGSSASNVGGKRITVYTPGSLFKADGGMVAVDEILDMKKEILSVIRYIMSSNNIPIRSIRTDISLNILHDSIPFYASVLSATNPLDQTKFNTLFFFHPEILSYANEPLSRSIAALLKRITSGTADETIIQNMVANPQDFVNYTLKSAVTEGSFSNELKHILSSTVYELVQRDFSRDVASKILDRFTFIVPNYTKVVERNWKDLDIRTGKFDLDESIIYEPEYGKIAVKLDDLRVFSTYIQTVSPYYDPGKDKVDTDGLIKLMKYGGKVSESVFSLMDSQLAKVIASSSIDVSVNAILRQLGPRESMASYKMLHTILKLYDMDKPNRAILKAVEFLLKQYYRITYMNPYNIVLGRMAVVDYVNKFINEMLIRAEALAHNPGEVYYTIDDVEKLADEILAEAQIYDPKYDVTIPYQDAKRLVVELIRILAADVDDERIRARAEQAKIIEKVFQGEDFAYRISLDDVTKRVLRSVTVETMREKGVIKVYLKVGDMKFKVLEVTPR